MGWFAEGLTCCVRVGVEACVIGLLNTGAESLNIVVGVLVPVLMVQSDDSSGVSPLSAWKRFALRWSLQAGLIILAGLLCTCLLRLCMLI